MVSHIFRFQECVILKEARPIEQRGGYTVALKCYHTTVPVAAKLFFWPDPVARMRCLKCSSLDRNPYCGGSLATSQAFA